jgi:hypothetical protein
MNVMKKTNKIAQFSYKQNLIHYSLDKQSMIDNIIYLEIKKIIICEIMLQNHKLDEIIMKKDNTSDKQGLMSVINSGPNNSFHNRTQIQKIIKCHVIEHE